MFPKYVIPAFGQQPPLTRHVFKFFYFFLISVAISSHNICNTNNCKGQIINFNAEILYRPQHVSKQYVICFVNTTLTTQICVVDRFVLLRRHDDFLLNEP